MTDITPPHESMPTVRRERNLKLKTLHEFFVHELGDMLDAELQLTKVLPAIHKETTDPQLRERIRQHLDETRQHVRNLEACFEALGEKVKTEKCAGMAGILMEKEKLLKEMKPSEDVLQAINFTGSLKVEQYETAAYTSLIGLAHIMGHVEAEQLLKDNLQDENNMEKFLEQNAARLMDELALKTGDKNMAMAGQRS